MGYDLNTESRQLFEYDPVTNIWTQKNPSPVGGIVTSVVINDKAYLVQGQSVWMYDPQSDTYSMKKIFPASQRPDAAFEINGEGYFVAGTQFWKYNAATDSWLQKSSLSQNLEVKAGFKLNNYGYVLADSSKATYEKSYPLRLWRYDLAMDKWERIYNDYPGYGAYLVQTITVNGIAYAGFGYNNGDMPVGDLWKYQ
jgi:hypothetical protein